MGAPTRPPANGFVATARHIYSPIGFSKGYNFVLWVIFAGGLLGFVCARILYLDYDGYYCNPHSDGGFFGAAPGECWSYSQEFYLELGIKLHLWTILPAGFLAFLQFLPVLRHKVILFHRINGYATIMLAIVGTAGAMMISRVAFGGGVELQAVLGLLAIMFLGSLLIALYNIKRLQLEQHRAWMIRAWVYAGAIITCRLIMFASAIIISYWGPLYLSFKCDKLASFYEDEKAFLDRNPSCKSHGEWIAVKADLVSGEGGENAAAAMDMTFGMSVWLALALHAIGVEIYLRLTPAEFERLRNISYRRQLEAKFKNPGSAGLTVDRLGDSAGWVPEAAAAAGHRRESQYALIQQTRETDPNSSVSGPIPLQPHHSSYDTLTPFHEDTRYDPGSTR